MPKVIFGYRDETLKGSWQLGQIKRGISSLVAETMSTDTVTLDPSTDIDFIPVFCDGDSQTADIWIEIETIGFANRKKKFRENPEILLNLKTAILTIDGFPDFDPKNPLIWIKYQDPDGPHF